MNFIPLMSPNLTEDDISAVVGVLRTGMLVQGPRVEELEREVSAYLGVRHAVATANGTATLHLALTALGIGPGDEVIVPALSHVATANVVELTGANCVFVDVGATTFNIEADGVERAITEKTRALMPVHEFGLACDIQRMNDIAAERGIFVIEDAACALGSKVGRTNVGAFGVLGSFSLHPRKAITAGEGGLLTTNDDGLAERLRVLRNHGMGKINDGKVDVVEAGFNYRLTDFQAALVLSQLRRLGDNIAAKRRLASVYLSELVDVKGITLPDSGEEGEHTWQTFHIVLDDGYDRDDVIERLRERGIGTNFGAHCIPSLAYYRQKYGLDSASLFPKATAAYERGLALPIYEKLTEEDVRAIAQNLVEVLNS